MMASRKPVPDLADQLPQLRGRVRGGVALAPLTWFRVGGPPKSCSARPISRTWPPSWPPARPKSR
jgi:hypothetical protein